MRLSDIMSSMQLESYAEVALLIFLCAFFAIVVRLVFFSKKKDMDDAARIPLEDEPVNARTSDPHKHLKNTGSDTLGSET